MYELNTDVQAYFFTEEFAPLNEHVLIGVSPFNRYFSQENLEKIISWGLNNFKHMHIFLPDEIYTYTFLALGYSPERARKKTRRQDCYLKNKVVKALINNDIAECNTENYIVLLSHLRNNQNYVEIYHNCLDLFEYDEFFRQGCLATSKWIIDHKNISQTFLSEDMINTAVKYFLAELPLFLNTPKILDTPSSVFMYSDIPEFLKNIYKQKLYAAPKQAFLKLVLDC